MPQYQIGIVVGSLRKDSSNKKLAQALTKLAPSEFTFKFLDISQLPLYNQDNDGKHPESVNKLKSDVKDAHGILFVTPEYNRSIPGVLKNALDHASRPYGANSWAVKPAAIIGTSQSNVGTAMAQQHLRNILSYLDMRLMHQPEAYIKFTETLIDKDGNIGAENKDFMQKWMNAFVEWIKKHNM